MVDKHGAHEGIFWRTSCQMPGSKLEHVAVNVLETQGIGKIIRVHEDIFIVQGESDKADEFIEQLVQKMKENTHSDGKMTCWSGDFNFELRQGELADKFFNALKKENLVLEDVHLPPYVVNKCRAMPPFNSKNPDLVIKDITFIVRRTEQGEEPVSTKVNDKINLVQSLPLKEFGKETVNAHAPLRRIFILNNRTIALSVHNQMYNKIQDTPYKKNISDQQHQGFYPPAQDAISLRERYYDEVENGEKDFIQACRLLGRRANTIVHAMIGSTEEDLTMPRRLKLIRDNWFSAFVGHESSSEPPIDAFNFQLELIKKYLQEKQGINGHFTSRLKEIGAANDKLIAAHHHLIPETTDQGTTRQHLLSPSSMGNNRAKTTSDDNQHSSLGPNTK